MNFISSQTDLTLLSFHLETTEGWHMPLISISSVNRWMLLFSSVLTETDKSSIEALYYCKIDIKIF